MRTQDQIRRELAFCERCVDSHDFRIKAIYKKIRKKLLKELLATQLEQFCSAI